MKKRLIKQAPRPVQLIFAILITVMLAIALAGCGKSANVPDTDTAETTAAAASAAESLDAPVTLRFAWWGSDARHEATLKAIEKYTELHPNVTIEGEYQGYDGYQQKLMTQIVGKTEPDLMQLDYIWYPDLAEQSDIFVNMGENDKIDLSAYSKSVLQDYCSIDGKVISLPMGTNGFGIMINKAFFDKHNIPLDTVWTWETLIEEGRRVHEANPTDYLFALESGTSTGGIGPFVMGAYLYSKTGSYWANEADNTINASREELTEAFTMVRDLYESGAAQPLGEASLFTGQMEQNPKWLNAEMGFTIDWSSTVGKYKGAIGEENFAVGMPPFAEGGNNQKISIKPSMVLAVSSRSKNVEVAADFANWMMTDPEAAKILGTQRSVPTSQVAFDTLNDAGMIDKDVAAICEFTNANPAEPSPLIQGNTEISDIVKNICEQVIFGELTPEAAADKFLNDVQAKMNTLK